MRYWVIKGNPYANDWDAMLIPNREDVWHTGRAPKDWAAGDRLFCWESTPDLRVIGLALLVDTDCGRDENGDHLFGVRYLTQRLRFMPGIHELRQFPTLSTASFLKSGPATTLFPLSSVQGELLFRLLATRNDNLNSIWTDIAQELYAGIVPDVDGIAIATEGGMRLVSHMARERSRAIAEAKKRNVLAATGALRCEVCGFDFREFYGSVGEGFSEVHHRIPLADADSAIETRLDDLAIVCSNCHRMLHRELPFPSVEVFRSHVASKV